MIAINNIVLPEPVSIKTSDEDIVKQRTTASGRTVIDYITTKKVIDVVWGVLNDSDMQVIINTIRDNKPFFFLTYSDTGGSNTITAYTEKVQRSIQNVYGGQIVWANLHIVFKEK